MDMRRSVFALAVVALLVGCQSEPTAKSGPTVGQQGPGTEGEMAPALVVDQTYNWDGELDLADFTGKVVVLDFWTYW